MDSWRGIAALVVAVYHFSFVMQETALQSAILVNAYLFVDFFFVLSGFVICHAYRHRLNAGRDVAGFVIRRLGRLWPLHAAVLAVFALAIAGINLAGFHPPGLAIRAAEGDYSLLAFALNALLLNSMSLYGSAWNGPAWSIGAELYTYLLFAAVALLAARRLATVALVLAAGAAAGLLMLAPSYMNSTADYGLLRCIAGFFVGIGVHHLHERTKAAALPLPTVAELAVVGAAGLFMVMAGNGPDDVYALSVAAPLVFGAALLVFAREAGGVSRLLRARPLSALGRWSYSIYMVHMPLLVLTGYGVWLYGTLTGTAVEQFAVVNDHVKQLYDLDDPLTMRLLLAAFLVATVSLAALSYRTVEAPWRDRFNRLAKRVEQGARIGGRPTTSSGRRLASGRSAPV
ncbi:MAG TPA: acyltransferase [Xanthobacteraceae bacterium]|nr:acyltransferase [Xanthobacteraceae bacterium]